MAFKKITSPEFRVSFANVFKPSSFEGQEPKYGVTMLIPKTVDISKLKALAKEAVEEKWPDEAKRPKGLKHPFRDGDKEKPDTKGYTGHWFIRANSKIQPKVVDRAVNPIMDETEFYSGCYAIATITAYGYDVAGNRGVAFGLQNIQKVKDGEPFSGRSNPEDDFTSLEPEAGDDFSSEGGAVEAVDDFM